MALTFKTFSSLAVFNLLTGLRIRPDETWLIHFLGVDLPL